MIAQVKAWAAELGFDDCRIARATEATHADAFRKWIAEGKHGEMGWLERTPADRIAQKRRLLLENRALKSRLKEEVDDFAGLGAAMRGVCELIDRVAPSEATVPAHSWPKAAGCACARAARSVWPKPRSKSRPRRSGPTRSRPFRRMCRPTTASNA